MAMRGILDTETINGIIEEQLDKWPLARRNYLDLVRTERKPFRLGDFRGAVQCNPARIRSTGAATDAASIAARPCFLCASNRPDTQSVLPWLEGWDFLVNPYPIFPVHFTIVSQTHRPQGAVPFDMAAMAEKAPSLAFFFNGARAGASAPDHLHAQAVLKSELPLLDLIERIHPDSTPGWTDSADSGADLPFRFFSAVVTPDGSGMKTLAGLHGLTGIDAETGKQDRDLLNAYFWTAPSGLLRIAVVPRKRHRPLCYTAPEGERFVVSPGAVDMAGLVITPRREDFDRISAADVAEIYSQTALPNSK